MGVKKVICPGYDLTDTPDNAIHFECGDSSIAEMISECGEVTAFCHRTGESSQAVREEGLTEFRKHVRLLGLGIR